jgi:hypothetical protein
MPVGSQLTVFFVLPEDGDEGITEVARSWRQHFARSRGALRHQNVVTCGGRLSVFSAPSSQQKFPETGTTKSEKQPKSKRCVLQQWMLSAEPHAFCESERRHLKDFHNRCTLPRHFPLRLHTRSVKQAVQHCPKIQRRGVRHCTAEPCCCLAPWARVWCGVAKTYLRQLDVKQKKHTGVLVELVETAHNTVL